MQTTEQGALDVRKIAAAVVAYLPGWAEGPHDQDERPTFARLRAHDGAEIFLHLDTHARPARLNISGGWPRSKRNGEQFMPYQNRPGIGVSATRPAATIAGEIQRRFLPDYLKLYAEALERLRDSEARNVEAERLAAQLAELLDANISDGAGSGRSDELRLWPSLQEGRVEVRVRRFGGYRFEIDASRPEIALAIAGCLGAFTLGTHKSKKRSA